MITELVTFRTPDHLALDAAFYRPDSGPRPHLANLAVLLVHGKTHNFYSGPSRFLAPPVVERGFAALAINRRGHDVIHADVGERGPGGAGGAAYEVFADSQQDLRGAADWLAERGFARLALVGHSFGGVISTVFAARHPERVAALALCSPVAGGPSYLERVSEHWLAGEDLPALLDRARELRAAGRGEELLLARKWWWAISARSALELDVPGLAESATGVRCPTLAIRGSLEIADLYPIERVREATDGRAAIQIVDGADHYYTGREDRVGELVAGWLAETRAR